MCSYALCLFQKQHRCHWKNQCHDDETTTNRTSRVHNDQHRAACTLYRALHSSHESRSLQYISAPSVRCGLLTALWQQGISKEMYHGNLNDSTNPSRGKKTQNGTNCKRTEIRRTKQRRERVRSSKARRTRDASPVSVVFGEDRGQVLLSRFAQLPFVATCTACC